MMNRSDYAKLPIAELKRRLDRAEDRITRANTTEAYLTDAFAVQELGAAIEEKEKAA